MAMAEEIVNVISKINICFILGGRVTIKLEVHECQMVKILCQSKFNSLKKAPQISYTFLHVSKGKEWLLQSVSLSLITGTDRRLEGKQ